MDRRSTLRYQRQEAKALRATGLALTFVASVLTTIFLGWLGMVLAFVVAVGVLMFCIGADALDMLDRHRSRGYSVDYYCDAHFEEKA